MIFLAIQSLKQTYVKDWKPKFERTWKLCEDAAIKTQMLSEFDANENGTGSMKLQMLKLQI